MPGETALLVGETTATEQAFRPAEHQGPFAGQSHPLAAVTGRCDWGGKRFKKGSGPPVPCGFGL